MWTLSSKIVLSSEHEGLLRRQIANITSRTFRHVVVVFFHFNRFYYHQQKKTHYFYPINRTYSSKLPQNASDYMLA